MILKDKNYKQLGFAITAYILIGAVISLIRHNKRSSNKKNSNNYNIPADRIIYIEQYIFPKKKGEK